MNVPDFKVDSMLLDCSVDSSPETFLMNSGPSLSNLIKLIC